MATYRIIVKNQSGSPQDYSFFNDRPTVAGGMPGGDIWSNVMKTAKGIPDGGSASFEVSTNYYAICGSCQGTPGSGAKVTISKAAPVQLGRFSAGKYALGSTVPLVVHRKSACDLGATQTPGCGRVGNFQLDTTCRPENAFTVADARANNLLIGIATSTDGDNCTAMATFHPAPNFKYQIQPKAIYYVAAGENFQVGQLINAEMVGVSQPVDFEARQSNEVVIVHADYTLSFQ
ncbi:hypothetical protein ACHAPT_011802 [Fusarium lateritium]